MLIIKDVTKKFGEKIILNSVSLKADTGEIAVLLGQSGVGKSTLLRVLNNLETLDSGSIFLDGKLLDITKMNQQHIVGMVFQNFNLFDHLTVKENITLPLLLVLKKDAAQADVIAHELLMRFGLADKADKYPSQLSGGQKQRLAIARTLALKPKIVCLDEPTSALDPLLTSFVAKNIQDLSHQDYTVLVATHDIGLLEKLSCTIFLMEDGRIIETAASSDFFRNRSIYPKIAQFVAGTSE